MEEKHCDMCAYYHEEDDDDGVGWCSQFRERHLPTDGKNCGGWEYWKDNEDEAFRN